MSFHLLKLLWFVRMSCIDGFRWGNVCVGMNLESEMEMIWVNSLIREFLLGAWRRKVERWSPGWFSVPKALNRWSVRAPDFLVYGVWGMHELYTIMSIFLGIAVLPRLFDAFYLFLCPQPRSKHQYSHPQSNQIKPLPNITLTIQTFSLNQSKSK